MKISEWGEAMEKMSAAELVEKKEAIEKLAGWDVFASAFGWTSFADLAVMIDATLESKVRRRGLRDVGHLLFVERRAREAQEEKANMVGYGIEVKEIIGCEPTCPMCDNGNAMLAAPEGGFCDQLDRWMHVLECRDCGYKVFDPIMVVGNGNFSLISRRR